MIEATLGRGKPLRGKNFLSILEKAGVATEALKELPPEAKADLMNNKLLSEYSTFDGTVNYILIRGFLWGETPSPRYWELLYDRCVSNPAVPIDPGFKLWEDNKHKERV